MMKINGLRSCDSRGLSYNVGKYENNYAAYKQIPCDSVSFSTKEVSNPIINVAKAGNVLRISFGQKLKDPTELTTSIQMKVRGVTSHQMGGLTTDSTNDANVVNLANSNWEDGKKLGYEIRRTDTGNMIVLYDYDYDIIGRVPDEISDTIIKLIEKSSKGNPQSGNGASGKRIDKTKTRSRSKNVNPQTLSDFKFELSNVIAGTTKGAPTIGLRVNLKYIGDNPTVKKEVNKVFNELLDSKSKQVQGTVLQYQPSATPSEVLQRIFDISEAERGEGEVKKIQYAIDSIIKEIDNPENKNILLVGHTKPDGDTLGCIVGMQAAISAAYPNKKVDCTVDDKIPGLFRRKMPGIINVKRPYSQERIDVINGNIEKLKSQPQTEDTKYWIRFLQRERTELQNPANLFDPDTLKGQQPKKYDVVILMDLATPERFSTAYKDYIENAKSVIFIDHHPARAGEWEQVRDKTGIDIQDIKSKKHALVVDMVPAATQLVTIVADQAGMLDKMFRNSIEKAKIFVASTVTGMSTDTGSFTRTANLLPKHSAMPVAARPNFLPEGMSKSLIKNLEAAQDYYGVAPESRVDKKWLRESITYDIPDEKETTNGRRITDRTARELMIQYALRGQDIYGSAGVGFIEIPYDEMNNVWNKALVKDPEVTLLDVQNAFKYSEVMGGLKTDPATTPQAFADPQSLQAIAPERYIYRSRYESDKIAVLMVQDKKKGVFTESGDWADQNGIRMSFRSQDSTIHAELLASLFGGGGHGGAAGGRIDLPGVELDSKLVVKINGEPVYDPKVVYQELKRNYEINHSDHLLDRAKIARVKDIRVDFAPSDSGDEEHQGKTAQKIIVDLVKCIREEQEEEKRLHKEQRKAENEVKSFDKYPAHKKSR